MDYPSPIVTLSAEGEWQFMQAVLSWWWLKYSASFTVHITMVLTIWGVGWWGRQGMTARRTSILCEAQSITHTWNSNWGFALCSTSPSSSSSSCCSQSTLPCLIPPYRPLSYVIAPYPTLPYPVLPRLLLPCPALPCPAMKSHTLYPLRTLLYRTVPSFKQLAHPHSDTQII